MGAAYHINNDEGLITVRAEGHMEPRTLQAIGRALLEDGSFDPDLPQLMDFRGLQLAAEALQDLETFVKQVFRCQVKGTVAVVIDDDLDAHLCADIYRLTSSVARAELFEDYEQALKWIMRREFLPHPPLLEQQNAPHDARNHAPE